MTQANKDLHDKPLDKMTVTELREVAKELPELTGVHGMKKAELLAAIMKARGQASVKAPKKLTGKPNAKTAVTVQELKAIIKLLKQQREQALADQDKKTADIYRRRISKLKKKTRRAA